MSALAVAPERRTRRPKAPTPTAPAPIAPPVLGGSATPRIGPPLPPADLTGYIAAAQGLGLTMLPWQECAAHYLEAKNPEGRHLYRDVVILVARQNGKTEMMLPYIVAKLRKGKRILHVSHNRELTRVMFERVSEALSAEPDLFATRRTPGGRDKPIWPRHGSGQEEIKLADGGWYRIAASTRGGARGMSAIDVLIVDETRELRDDDSMAAAVPTQASSPDPITIYLSNAGDADSVVLNDLRGMNGQDPRLAWLEWSADPARDAGDRAGWAEANPRLGHFPQLITELEGRYLRAQLTGKMATFETEYLCRWVTTMTEPLADAKAWADCRADDLGPATRPYMAVSLDPSGKRASAYLAWRLPDDTVALRLVVEAVGSPIDTDKLGTDLKAAIRQHKVRMVAFDPMTDAALTVHFDRKEPVAGAKYANATANFVSLIEGGRLRWESDCATVGEDLTWTTRKAHDEKGAYEAVRGKDDRPITAALAAIRATWLASAPRTRPRITGGF